MKANVKYNLKGNEEPGCTRHGRKLKIYPLWGMVPSSGFWGSNSHAAKIHIYYVFSTLAPQKNPKMSTLEILGPTMSATLEFEGAIEPNLAPRGRYLKPDDTRKGYHGPTMSNRTHFQVTKSPES